MAAGIVVGGALLDAIDVEVEPNEASLDVAGSVVDVAVRATSIEDTSLITAMMATAATSTAARIYASRLVNGSALRPDVGTNY